MLEAVPPCTRCPCLLLQRCAVVLTKHPRVQRVEDLWWARQQKSIPHYQYSQRDRHVNATEYASLQRPGQLQEAACTPTLVGATVRVDIQHTIAASLNKTTESFQHVSVATPRFKFTQGVPAATFPTKTPTALQSSHTLRIL